MPYTAPTTYTKLSNVIVPEIFAPAVIKTTELKSRLINSRVMVSDGRMTRNLRGGGTTFNQPTFLDLGNAPANISSDTGADAVPSGIGSTNEIQVRLSRNKPFASASLVSALTGEYVASVMRDQVGDYWQRELQRTFVATAVGVFANNALPTDAYHTQNDMIYDISGSAYVAGQTSITGDAVIDTMATMGDSIGELSVMLIHSTVYARLLKNDLLDVRDAEQGRIYYYMDKEVIVDDSVPHDTSNGIYQSWFMGRDVFRFGANIPLENPAVEILRQPLANNGGGESGIQTRVEWIVHPRGYAWVGTAAPGGPANLATANNLANGNSWQRAWPERQQIRMASLITRETAAVAA